MFFPGMTLVPPGSRTVFSFAGPAQVISSLDGNFSAANTSQQRSPVTSSGSPSKKRSRAPPLPFRLPSEDEENSEKGTPGTSSGTAGLSSGSGGQVDESMSVSPSKQGVTNFIKRRSLDGKDSPTKMINRLLAFSGHLSKDAVQKMFPDLISEKEKPSEKILSPADLDKHLRWCRSSGVEIFWSSIQKKDNPQPVEGYKCFESVYQAAINTTVKYMSILDKAMKPSSLVKLGCLSIEVVPFLSKNFAGLILASYKRSMKFSAIDEIFEHFYATGFRAWMNINDQSEKNKDADAGDNKMDCDTEAEEDCEACFENPCCCQKIMALFKEANLALHALGLMDELAGPRLYSVIQNEVTEHINQCVSEKYDVGHLTALMKWFNKRHKMWIETIYPWMTGCDEKTLKKVSGEFLQMLLDVYGKCIISDMFSIIIEFPESQPILEDLRYCMKQVNLRSELVSVLKSALERRLLNAGVNTDNVLEAYVATVRALKFVDPSGILAQLVTPPVREYLKHREETVRVILVSLTDESGELAEELSKNPTYVDKKNINMTNWRTWDPDPIDVPNDKFNLRKSDLIQALVSIYGSKTVFIDEYRALLADRLLRMPKPGSITREVKCLELLKLRFGESDLQKCEVMLKDVFDSQRLNVRFYEEEGAALVDCAVKLTGLVVSAQFWPTFKQESFELPKPVEEAMEKYTKAFEMIKGNRTLEWQKQIGTVELEVEHGGTTISLTVSPAQATVLWHFQEKSQWTLDELAQITGTTVSAMKSRVAFWVSKGILMSLGDGLYGLVDNVTENSKPVASKYTEEVENDSVMTSTSTQRATELQMFWSYIEGMLTNLDSLPLARIHSMLKLFATVECSSEELQKFLDEKVSQNMLVYSAGQYQLPK